MLNEELIDWQELRGQDYCWLFMHRKSILSKFLKQPAIPMAKTARKPVVNYWEMMLKESPG